VAKEIERNYYLNPDSLSFCINNKLNIINALSANFLARCSIQSMNLSKEPISACSPLGFLYVFIHTRSQRNLCYLGIIMICYFIHSHTAIIVVTVKYLYQLKSIVSAFTCRVFSAARTII
jgi:hypothetical protein